MMNLLSKVPTAPASSPSIPPLGYRQNKFVEAIRFMAIDEAAGLGKNFDMLYEIARANDYQILSLSIKPNKVEASKQNIYLLHNSLEYDDVNYQPIPIFGLS